MVDMKLRGFGVQHFRCGVYAFFLTKEEAEAQARYDRTTVITTTVDRQEYNNLTWSRVTEDTFIGLIQAQKGS